MAGITENDFGSPGLTLNDITKIQRMYGCGKCCSPHDFTYKTTRLTHRVGKNRFLTLWDGENFFPLRPADQWPPKKESFHYHVWGENSIVICPIG